MQNPSYTSIAAIAAIAAGTLAVASFAPQANAAVVITEIIYNHEGSENASVEWFEIYNTGTEAVDLSGWKGRRTSTGAATDSSVFPVGTSLAPSAAAIILQDPSTASVAVTPATNPVTSLSNYNFANLWGPNIQLITVSAGLTLANGGTRVALVDASNVEVDVVSYSTPANGWPAADTGTTDGVSIYLKPGFIDTTSNDVGTNWARSTVGVDGASLALTIHPLISNALFADTASPGVVVVPEPMSLSLIIGAATLGLARRRRSSK